MSAQSFGSCSSILVGLHEAFHYLFAHAARPVPGTLSSTVAPLHPYDAMGSPGVPLFYSPSPVEFDFSYLFFEH